MADNDEPPADRGSAAGPGRAPATTAWLLDRVRQGDAAAREQLVRRFLPALRRWAHRRLPRWARDLRETDELVHDTFLRALNHVDTFEARRRGAFFAYLTRITRNLVTDEIRRSRRRPAREELGADLEAGDRSPLETAIGSETVADYEAALDRLPPRQREAVVLSIELCLSWEQVAEVLGCNPKAARMRVKRALVRLAREMSRNRGKEKEP